MRFSELCFEESAALTRTDIRARLLGTGGRER